MNTICEICNNDKKSLMVIIVKETKCGLVPICVCGDCSINIKIGDIL
jgi:hypothetical protein